VNSLAENQNFRKDIQGLRGLAVLAVVLYHANLPVSGGFLGVDVFFVISGFIVTTVILREVDRTGRISLKDFYVRRIRRILPMFTLATVMTVALTMVFLSPFGDQQQAFSTSRWAAFFASNYQLQFSDSYENLVGNPFRHLWSLSVEEQFYVVLPVVLIVAIRFFGKGPEQSSRWRAIFFAIAAIVAVASFALALNGSASEATASMAFFSLPTRAWELCAGVLAAVTFSSVRLGKVAAFSLGSLGFVVITASMFLVDGSTPHPGLATLAPVLGTVMLILVGSHSVITHRVLSCKPLVWLGDRSYGWYLWHWPLVVFAALIIPENTAVLVFASVIAVVISSVTYRNVEEPIRRNSLLSGRRSVMILGGSVSLILVVSFLANRLADTGLGLFDPAGRESNFERSFDLYLRGQDMEGSCFLRNLETTFNDVNVISRECSNQVKSERTEVLLMGDSTALAASEGYFDAATKSGVRAVAFAAAGCPTIDGAPRAKKTSCPPIQDIYRNLVKNLRPRVVVMVNRFDLYVEPLGEVKENDHRILSESGAVPENQVESLQNLLISLSKFVSEIRANGSEVVVMLQPPPGIFSNWTLFERWSFGIPFKEDYIATMVQQRKTINNAIVSLLAGRRGVHVYDPGSSICGNPKVCRIRIADGVPYADETHLTPAGSMKLSEGFRKIFSGIFSS